MIEVLRQWIVGITCAAIIGALAECVMPENGPKKVGRLVIGLLLALAVLKPLVTLDVDALADLTALEYGRAEEYGQGLAEKNEVLVKAIIEEQTAAYISDKAEALGMECTVQVAYHYGEDGAIWPEAVVVRGEFTQMQQDSLSHVLEAELAVPVENQTFERVSDQ